MLLMLTISFKVGVGIDLITYCIMSMSKLTISDQRPGREGESSCLLPELMLTSDCKDKLVQSSGYKRS